MPPPMAILSDSASTATCDVPLPSAKNVAGNANDNSRVGDGDLIYFPVDPLLPRSRTESHAILGSLVGPGLIERYSFHRRAHRRRTRRVDHREHSLGEVAVANVRFGDRLNGHDGVVHGGIVTLLFDDFVGWGYNAMMRYFTPLTPSSDDKVAGKGYESFPIGVTANLNVNFRSPLRAGVEGVMRIYHVKTDGRKIHFSERLESPDGETLYADGTALFVVLKSSL